MLPHVSRDVTSLCARVVTLFAFERFFSCVSPHVLLEISSCCAAVAALVATMGILGIMQSFLEIFCHFDFPHMQPLLRWGCQEGWGISGKLFNHEFVDRK